MEGIVERRQEAPLAGKLSLSADAKRMGGTLPCISVWLTVRPKGPGAVGMGLESDNFPTLGFLL